jgi:hypothetical protein
MDSLPGAAALARGLLVLARSEKSGVLRVDGERLTARIGVRAGRVVAMRIDPDDGDGIGRALREMDAWDEDRAVRGGTPPPGIPVGLWSIKVGATTPAALSHALRQQLRRRIARLFAIDLHELHLKTGSSDVGVSEIREPPTSAELIVSALRASVERAPAMLLRRRLGDGVLVMTPIGRELCEEAVLWPDEQAMLPLLSSGESVAQILAASGGSTRALRMLYALRMLGACGAPETTRDGYALLLRKARQVRRGAKPSELLDLPHHARGAQARRAMRKIASTVHPDRFGDAPEAIRSASHAVMTALVRAQRDLGS